MSWYRIVLSPIEMLFVPETATRTPAPGVAPPAIEGDDESGTATGSRTVTDTADVRLRPPGAFFEPLRSGELVELALVPLFVVLVVVPGVVELVLAPEERLEETVVVPLELVLRSVVVLDVAGVPPAVGLLDVDVAVGVAVLLVGARVELEPGPSGGPVALPVAAALAAAPVKFVAVEVASAAAMAVVPAAELAELDEAAVVLAGVLAGVVSVVNAAPTSAAAAEVALLPDELVVGVVAAGALELVEGGVVETTAVVGVVVAGGSAAGTDRSTPEGVIRSSKLSSIRNGR